MGMTVGGCHFGQKTRPQIQGLKIGPFTKLEIRLLFLLLRLLILLNSSFVITMAKWSIFEPCLKIRRDHLQQRQNCGFLPRLEAFLNQVQLLQGEVVEIVEVVASLQG